MDQIIEFVGNHLGPVIALVVILTLLVQNLIGGGGGRDAVDPVRATELINHENAVVVDVRPMADFDQGHIIGAINIPSNGFANQLKQLERHKSKPINFEHFAGELDRLEAARQVVFRYVSPTGEIDPAWNFNGSARAIAGVCNEAGNVLGLMPHPERCAEEVRGNKDGLALFESLAQGAFGRLAGAAR